MNKETYKPKENIYARMITRAKELYELHPYLKEDIEKKKEKKA